MAKRTRSGLDQIMKRTITIELDVTDFDDYAKTVAELMRHPKIKNAKWTRGEEIKEILERDHGFATHWGSGSVTDGLGLRGSQ